MLIQGDQEDDSQESRTARHIAEEIARSLEGRLIPLRKRAIIGRIRVGRMGEPSAAVFAWQVFVPFHLNRRRESDMRPSALRVLCYYDDLIMVIASGNNAWPFKRLHLAHAVERAQGVLHTL